jgi:hypothetical protein
MKKSRSKIIIKTRKGGYTKLYANGKWQHRVTSLDFHAGVNGHINIECEFDTIKCNNKGMPIIENDKIVCKHHTVRI